MRWVDAVIITIVALLLWVVNMLLVPLSPFSKTATRLIRINNAIAHELFNAHEAKYSKRRL